MQIIGFYPSPVTQTYIVSVRWPSPTPLCVLCVRFLLMRVRTLYRWQWRGRRDHKQSSNWMSFDCCCPSVIEFTTSIQFVYPCCVVVCRLMQVSVLFRREKKSGDSVTMELLGYPMVLNLSTPAPVGDIHQLVEDVIPPSLASLPRTLNLTGFMVGVA